MKTLYKMAALALIFALLLTACGNGGTPDAQGGGFGTAAEPVDYEEFPVLDGSTANIPLMQALLQYYTGMSADEAEVRISVSTTDYAYYALDGGECDLLLVYEPSAETWEYIESMSGAFEMKPIGLDALVFICNDSNPVASLTQRQILDIYTGAVTDWSEVGGEDIDIVPYQRAYLSGSQTLMLKLVMGDEPIMEAPSELMPGGMGGLVDQIMEYENTGNALGYSVYYYIQNMYAFPEIKMLAVDGVMPSNETIRDGSYPYVNEFYAVIRKSEPADSLTREVFDFLSTDDGKALIEAAGYVSLP